jgi:hypothetical protein
MRHSIENCRYSLDASLIGEDPMQLERIRWKLAAPTALKLFGHVLGFAGIEFACLDVQG